MSNSPTPETTDFGFRTVARAAKKPMVRAVFESVAPRYDLMNDLMSLGAHRAWKRIFIDALAPSAGETLLDLAGGTGDISFGWLRAGGGRAILSDINPAMLAVARGRARARGIARGLDFLIADAEALPLPDRAVERVSIAFGLRNCTNKDAVLAEARRVLRPGGRFFVSNSAACGWPPWSRSMTPGPSRFSRASAAPSPMMARAINTSPKASAPSPIRKRWPR